MSTPAVPGDPAPGQAGPRPAGLPAERPGASANASGILAAIAAYSLWGLLPVFWKQFPAVQPVEILANRVLWSLLFTLALLGGLRRLGQLGVALRSPRERSGLALAGAFIALNWGTFIWAVQAGRIVETSLGYYLNPLLNALIGVLIFREVLAPAQRIAIALAAVGVGAQLAAFGRVPWVALVLASSFACYGVAKKRTHVPALASLAFETAALAPFAVGWLLLGTSAPGGALLSGPRSTQWLLLAAGPLTAAPLIAFAAAARRLPFTVLGLFQYLAPTLSLLLAVLVYGEPFTRAHTFSFACIWSALALFSTSTWQQRRAAAVA